MPKKMRRLAVRSALSAKRADGGLRFVDALSIETPRTRTMIEILQNLQVADAKTLIVLSQKDENITRSANNLPQVKTLLASYLNVIDLLKYDVVVVAQDALAVIENWLGGNAAGRPLGEVEASEVEESEEESAE
jgi:large subunit ribosomal protein L4